ncbi:Protein FAR1-RELATED SEQUENCE 5 [Glycine soja]|uniref:Protein FAR1-RELATED SEQUENCE 5 n=1 Tax=Glycine soja TaxID=3848 RepID=A0A445FUF9_GLYSO|nr:Protein FAR1-RELATED SEQUENCE 5 [Glycine soja]
MLIQMEEHSISDCSNDGTFEDVHMEDDGVALRMMSLVSKVKNMCFWNEDGLDDNECFENNVSDDNELKDEEDYDNEVLNDEGYQFYKWYAWANDFSIRKSHVLINKKGETLQQTFVCSKEGYRQDRGLSPRNRKHEYKNFTRCGCHRKITASDAMQIENYSKVVIRPPHIYTSLAQTSGGYNKVGYVRKDIYNYFARQGRKQSSDVNRALNYFHHLCPKDPMMVVAYIVDDENRLQHLFCVNRHNNTIVFATALVTNETEETYVWLLEQFLKEMKGKHPSSVITDGDLAMRAIRIVFPRTHHRFA